MATNNRIIKKELQDKKSNYQPASKMTWMKKNCTELQWETESRVAYFKNTAENITIFFTRQTHWFMGRNLSAPVSCIGTPTWRLCQNSYNSCDFSHNPKSIFCFALLNVPWCPHLSVENRQGYNNNDVTVEQSDECIWYRDAMTTAPIHFHLSCIFIRKMFVS